jgi:hypothetical protein
MVNPARAAVTFLQHSWQKFLINTFSGGLASESIYDRRAGRKISVLTMEARMRYMLAALLLPTAAWAQEGHIGHGHSTWHQDFYQHLVSPETKVSCCNLTDCRPTSGRTVGDHYEVKINGVWVAVLPSKVVKKSAPDQGFHVCAPTNFNGTPEHVYCVVLAPEM